MFKKSLFLTIILLVSLLFFHCSYEELEKNKTYGTVKGAEAWNYINNPSIMAVGGIQLEYKLSKLPKQGKAQHIPWPDTYWPTYQDSINARWQVIYDYKPVSKDTLSPAEKYDMAFNNWKPSEDFYKLKPYSSSTCHNKSWDNSYYEKLGPAANYVSKYKGNLEARDGKDNDNDGKIDECDDRDGVETWWGLCHAWAAVSILEKEPQKPVVYNGVKFEVSDIKALLIMMYDRSNAVLVGGRCNDKEVKRDPKTGRLIDSVCRDINPGTYHVVMANFLGIQKRAIASDQTYNYEVWNHPIIEWKVNSIKQIKKKDAIKLLGLPSTVKKYPYNKDADKIYEVYATTYYVTESYPSTTPFTDEIEDYIREDEYHYLLEVDKKGMIIGGEWLDTSHKDHPDFLWLPLAPGGGNPYIKMANVKILLEKSIEPETPSNTIKAESTDTPKDIPDNNLIGITSVINIAEDKKIKNVKVSVKIEHTWIGALVVEIKHGSKKKVLHNKEGGSGKLIEKTYDISDFNGDSSAGVWELTVKDTDAYNDTGKLLHWSIEIAY